MLSRLFLFFTIFVNIIFNTTKAEPFINEGLNAQVSLPRIEAIDKSQVAKAKKLTRYITEKYFIHERQAKDIVELAIQNAERHSLEAEIILAIIEVESSFNKNARSSLGALGLMQVLPKYHVEKLHAIGGTKGLYDVNKNIHVGTKILVEYLSIVNGDLKKALLRYNGSTKDKTQKYAKKVLQAYQNLKQLKTLPILFDDV